MKSYEGSYYQSCVGLKHIDEVAQQVYVTKLMMMRKAGMWEGPHFAEPCHRQIGCEAFLGVVT